MACMEHYCGACGHTVFNNLGGAGGPCPKCGSEEFISTWDEQDSYREDDRRDARDEDEEA
jgi:predicted  nucleic acid-binding Zn-ribbon protein